MSREADSSRSAGSQAALLALVLTALAGAPAWAQAVGDNGIKVGEGRVHPYLDLDLRYDSAAGFFAASTSVLSPELIAHFRPGLRLEMPSTNFTLNLSGDVDYVFYTGLLSPGSQSASHLEAVADINADFNHSGAVAFELGDHFSRLDRTTNAAVGAGVISLFNEAHASLPIHPGGGALEVTPRFAFALENLTPLATLPTSGCAPTDPSCSPTALNGMSYLNYQVGLNGRWRFLPKTAFILENAFDVRTYPSRTYPTQMILRSSGGLAGLVTSKLAVLLRAGWGQDFTGGASTVIAHAELNWLLSDTSSIKGGYLRDLTAVPVYGSFSDDRGYLEARFFLGGRLTLRGYGAFDLISFSGSAGPPPTSGRRDSVVTVDLGPEYQFTRWLIGALGYTLGARGSNQQAAASVNFTRHQAYLRLTLTY